MASQVARTAGRVGKGYLHRRKPKQPHEYASLIKDPAIERWSSMRETTTKHFKWTPKTFSLIVFWSLIVPGVTYYAIKEEVADRYEREGRERPKFFPDAELSSRRPDPLPPRKPGIKVNL